jgi:hypothetical protein
MTSILVVFETISVWLCIATPAEMPPVTATPIKSIVVIAGDIPRLFMPIMRWICIKDLETFARAYELFDLLQKE